MPNLKLHLIAAKKQEDTEQVEMLEKRIAGNGRPRLKRQYLSHWRITSIGTRTLNLLRESLKLLYGEKVNVS